MTSTMRWLFAAAALAAISLLAARRPDPEPPVKTPQVDATIAEAGFLAGRWQAAMGPQKDSFAEEIWSEPNGKNMIGMFRWNDSNGVSDVQEIISITEENGTLLLRLRHQNAAAIAWEDKDKPMVFVLAEKSPTLARFVSLRDTGSVAGCRYERQGDKLLIDVLFAPLSPEAAAAGKSRRNDLHFELTRAPLK
ncbi:MAG: hypothetical protein JSS51_02845 [Planctomycetes bacterium]|nr:hypothetical protein [Planctomycetota bacterium]